MGFLFEIYSHGKFVDEVDLCKWILLTKPDNLVSWLCVKPLLHSIVHARTSWLQKKSADLQGTLKVHVQFYNRISRSHRPCNENWHAHFLCVHAVWP